MSGDTSTSTSGDGVTGFLKDLVSDAADVVKSKYQRDLTVGSNANAGKASVGTSPNAPTAPSNAAPASSSSIPTWGLVALAVGGLVLVGVLVKLSAR